MRTRLAWREDATMDLMLNEELRTIQRIITIRGRDGFSQDEGVSLIGM